MEKNMTKLQIVPLIAILFLFFLSCSSQKSSGEFPYGSYSYKSFNIGGELIGDGTIYISKVDSNIVEGNWAIRDVRNCYVCGPQYGNGYLTGKIENDSLFINLNPDNPENYVELVGELKEEAFIGDWRWFELVVNSNRGTFKAFRM
jgi:hypothetical protein